MSRGATSSSRGESGGGGGAGVGAAAMDGLVILVVTATAIGCFGAADATFIGDAFIPFAAGVAFGFATFVFPTGPT